jgi:hypothetical protein
MKKIRKYRKTIAVFLLVCFLSELGLPITAFAITGHNSMPEYRSFEPVSTTNMVNMFDGGLSYNLPLLEIPNGYPINLSYHSNEVNNEAQSSWVGLGWTLNPGSINRVKRGFPDEFNGMPYTYHSKMPKNWTITGGTSASLEVLSKGGFGASAGLTLAFNNNTGLSKTVSGGLSALGGLGSLNFSYSAGKFGFSPDINPAKLLDAIKTVAQSDDPKAKKPEDQKIEKKTEEKVKKIENFDKLNKAQQDHVKAKLQEASNAMGSAHPQIEAGIGGASYSSGSGFSLSPRQHAPYPTSVNSYSGSGLKLRIDVGLNFTEFPLSGKLGIFGSYTSQEYPATKPVKAYGYMNSESAVGNYGPGVLMDYYTENDNMYEKRDKYLGVPLPNNDIYSLSGEAIGGSFKAYRSDFGHYTKDPSASETFIVSGGLDGKLPTFVTPAPTNLEFSLGGNLGGDHSSATSGPLYLPEVTNKRFGGSNAGNGFEKCVLRFSGDKSGNFSFISGSDEPQKAKFTGEGFQASDVSFADVSIGSAQGRNLRSSYVKINYLDDFQTKAYASTAKERRYRVFEKNLKILEETSPNNFVVRQYNNDRDNAYNSHPEQVAGEVVTYNSDGIRYVYGLPIYTKNEKELQHSVTSGQFSHVTGSEGLLVNLNGGFTEGSSTKKFGQEMTGGVMYATQFLLTQITSPDYVDRNMDGPSTDDFGSYTRFNYTRVAGGGGGWYSYRNPYNGSSFNYGGLSRNDDDMASMSYGEKELYFIHSVVSKTHVAIFYTEDRLEGLEALDPSLHNDINAIVKGRTPGNVSGGKYQKVLKKIELYAIDDCDEFAGGEGMIFKAKAGALPIKTVHFDYSYELCKNLPNNININNPSYVKGNGKLTLKKVWFEYNGKYASKIAPYVFDYKYPTATYPTKYSAFANYGGSKNENPDYAIINSDRWGNYRNYQGLKNDLGNLSQFWPYVDQDPGPQFDPAAWCLKKITLPSGGEIHIQYEQSDYQYVQNKRAMTMVPLSSYTDGNTQTNKEKFYVDLYKLGYTSSEITMDLVHDLFQPMLADKSDNRMYFNCLYRLVGDGNSVDFTTNNAEFIDGYTRINGYGMEQKPDGKMYPYFVLKNGSGQNFVSISHPTQNRHELPYTACKEFYKNNRQGLVTNHSNSLSDAPGGSEDDAKSKVLAMLSIAGEILGVSQLCGYMDPAMSYVRLQVPLSHSKLGGGVRVKRLMMYDQGSLTGVPSLYGQEYSYKTTARDRNGNDVVISSGVATNEPSSGRKENPLVNPLDKDHQSKLNAFMYGRDIYSNEGPIGESLLPSPSIGYSEIKVTNIHTGITSTGYEVHEYYTCKDFPFVAKNTSVSKRFETPYKIGGSIGSVGGSYSWCAPHLSQGYSFLINEMHGQVKRVRKYSAGSTEPIAEESYEYLKPGESVKVMDENKAVSNAVIGKETEMLAEAREVYDESDGLNVDVDVSAIGMLTPTPPPILVPIVYVKGVSFSGYLNENKYRTHVVTKIVSFPAMIKKVTNKADGITHITENVVYDKYTGNPVVVKSYDDFKQNVISQDFMASWDYKEMSAKSQNEGMFVSNTVVGVSGTLTYLDFLASGNCGAMNLFTRGDFLDINKGASTTKYLYHVDKLDFVNSRVYIIPSALNATAIPASAGYGLEIVHSGRTNQMNVKEGSLVMNNQANPFVMGVPPLNGDITNLLNQLNLVAGTTPSVTIASTPLNIINPNSGKCGALPDKIYAYRSGGLIHVDLGQDQTQTITEQQICGLPLSKGTPHQLVTDLNNYLNYYWGRVNTNGGNTTNIINPIFNSPQVVNAKYYTNYTNFNLGTAGVQNSYTCINGISGSTPVVGDANYLTTTPVNPNFVYYGYQLTATAPYQTATVYINPGTKAKAVNAGSVYSTIVPPQRYANNVRTEGTTVLPFNQGYTRTLNNLSACDEYMPYTSGNNLNNLLNFAGALNKKHTDVIGYFDEDDQGYLTYQKRSTTDNPVTCTESQRVFGLRFYQNVTRTVTIPKTCGSTVTPVSGGVFSYDETSGYIMYGTATCKVPVGCLKVCKDPSVNAALVVSANASTFSDDWDYTRYAGYTSDLYPIPSAVFNNLNAYESGANGKWRSKDQHTFRVSLDRTNVDGRNKYNYNTGLFDLEIFNWKQPQYNDPGKWVKVASTDKYDPNGEPLEDHNILNVYSTAIYGYDHTLPIAVAQNSRYRSVLYDGFENTYSSSGKNYFEQGLQYDVKNGGVLTNEVSHTGNYSIRLKPGGLGFPIGAVVNSPELNTEGASFRVWVYSTAGKESLKNKLNLRVPVPNTMTNQFFPLTVIASAGNWQLLEANIPGSIIPYSASSPSQTFPALVLDAAYSGNLYFDDIKWQSTKSEMVCYVYDKTQKLIAALDDQHFAVLYEYNAEGDLVRKLKETTQGIKTISETQYNTKGANRSTIK